MTIEIIERSPKHHIIKAPLERARIGGEFWVDLVRANGEALDRVFAPNIIVDNGIKQLGDILANNVSTDLDLEFIEPGEGTTAPVIGDIDIEDPLDPAERLAATSQTRSATTPFEVVISAFINSTKYTRPQIITELAVYFADDPSGIMFARGKLVTPITLNASDTATISYGILFR